jgi:hypothetical protein
VDFWKKEGEARYSCLEHPSAQEAQGAKGQGWGDGGWGMGDGMDANDCVCPSLSKRLSRKTRGSKRCFGGWGGVVRCGGYEYVRNFVWQRIGWIGRRHWWRRGGGGGTGGLAEVVERSVFLHPSDCRPERL